MQNDSDYVKEITKKSVDFSAWYIDVIKQSGTG